MKKIFSLIVSIITLTFYSFSSFAAGIIGENTAKTNRYQQQGFKTLADGEKQKQQPNHNHEQLAQADLGQTGGIPET